MKVGEEVEGMVKDKEGVEAAEDAEEDAEKGVLVEDEAAILLLMLMLLVMLLAVLQVSVLVSVVKKDAEEEAVQDVEKDAVEGVPVKGELLQILEGGPVDRWEEGKLLQMLEGEAVG